MSTKTRGGHYVVAPTITVLPDDPAGAVLLTGSHGGTYTGRLAAGLGTRGIVFHDAGIGLGGAGIAGLVLLDGIAIPAAALGHFTCRIGDTDDMLARGTVSTVNDAGAALGGEVGMTADEILEVFARGAVRHPVALPYIESRTELLRAGGSRTLVLVDSAASVDPVRDVGSIVVSGSHGALIGGNPAKALKAEAFAAVFNDAGIGIDSAGTARLAALDDRGIAALTVSGETARIGEAFSTLAGTVSAVNSVARRLGAVEGEVLAHRLLDWAR